MPYTPDWRSLRRHPVPEWLRDAKFGIYTHWGVYSVPACGPNGSWYPHNMYRSGTPQYEHHVKTYGGCERFGYKDFIPMLTGERFDADEWAGLFAESGARFAGPVAEHHDGFAMWDTRYSEWNAAKMGPKRDVVAELERAIRSRGLRFMVALHHMENWFFYPHWRAGCDAADPAFAGLYGEGHDEGASEDLDFGRQARPSVRALDRWYGKAEELIDRFLPDLIWFDFGLRYVREDYKKRLLAEYYGRAEAAGREVAALYKFNDLVAGAGVIDLELGRYGELARHDWITDTTVDDGEGWGYLRDAAYKPPARLIHALIDNVSKNGGLLLNVGPKPDGSISDEAKAILREIGAWLRVNGEAIYDTTPWLFYGEGPTKMARSGDFTEGERLEYAPEDVRYTAKGDAIYAIALGWPKGGLLLRSLAELYPGEVRRVTLLGAGGELRFAQGPGGLRVEFPPDRPCDHAFALKIETAPPTDSGGAKEVL